MAIALDLLTSHCQNPLFQALTIVVYIRGDSLMIRSQNPAKKVLAATLSLLAFILLPITSFARAQQSSSGISFKTPSVHSNAGGLQTIVGDVNGDGLQDVIYLQYKSLSSGGGEIDAGVMLGQSGGGLTSPKTFLVASGSNVISSYYQMYLADFNKDGKLDLFVFSPDLGGQAGAFLFSGNGDGTFQTTPSQPVALNYLLDSSAAAVADVNGDGNSDLVIATFYISFETPAAFYVFPGKGDGTFGAPKSTILSGNSITLALDIGTAMTLTDINADGKLDILTPIGDHVTVALGNGDGTFKTLPSWLALPSGYQTVNSPSQIFTEDVNGDGKPDIEISALPDSSSSQSSDGAVNVIFLGHGDGTFQASQLYHVGGGFAALSGVKDVNGDGKADLINGTVCDGNSLYACSSGIAYPIAIVLGNGDGTFQSGVGLDGGGVNGSINVTVADLNGDNKQDLIASRYLPSNATDSLSVLINSDAACTTPPTLTLHLSQNVLWPPFGEKLPVFVYGTVADSTCAANLLSAAYAVTDEYGAIQPTGKVSLDDQGRFFFPVRLQASRRGYDKDGRLYTITMNVTNDAGVTTSKSANVVVPHSIVQFILSQ